MTGSNCPFTSLSKTSRFLHLISLCTLTIAQPLFSLFGQSPEFFVVRRLEAIELALFSILFVFVLPIFLVSIEVLAGKWGQKLHLLIVFVLSLFLFSPPFQRLGFGDHPPIFLLGTFVLSLGTSWAYKISSSVRTFVGLLSISSVVCPIVFLTSPGIYPLLISTSLGSVGNATISRSSPVIMVIFDELSTLALMNRNQEIDPIRFPNFAAFAREATWYRNFTTTSSKTERAVPTLLTGKLARTDLMQMPNYRDHPQNLFTVLSKSHTLKVFEQITHLCPTQLCRAESARNTVLGRLISLVSDVGIVYLHIVVPEPLRKRWAPDISTSWGDFLHSGAPAEPKRAKSRKGIYDKGEWADDEWLFHRFLSSLDQPPPQSGHPLAFLHITLPHVPFRFLPDGTKYLRGVDRSNGAGFRRSWGGDAWETDQALQRYLLQVMYVDTLLGKLVHKLKEVKLWDESLIILTSDHGTSFQSGEFSRRVSPRNYMDVMLSALFVKYPGQAEGGINDLNAQTIDILPTILDAQGSTPLSDLDGHSLLDSTVPRLTKVFQPLEKGKPNQEYPPFLPVEPTLTRYSSFFEKPNIQHPLYSIGPHPEALGKRIGEIPNARALPLILEDPADFEAVQKRSGFIPALIRGTVSLPPEGGTQGLLIAVNGIIAGTTWVSEKTSAPFFSVLVSPDFFHDGKNTVSVYAQDDNIKQVPYSAFSNPF